eukprot:SAG31_NODE_9417_length_1281_cov_1.441624_2_plen_100_part_01
MRAFAFMEGATCAGVAVGPLCGGAMVRMMRASSMLGEYTAALRATFCAAAVAVALLLLLTILIPLRVSGGDTRTAPLTNPKHVTTRPLLSQEHSIRDDAR